MILLIVPKIIQIKERPVLKIPSLTNLAIISFFFSKSQCVFIARTEAILSLHAIDDKTAKCDLSTDEIGQGSGYRCTCRTEFPPTL
jgi:hypothetical protein